MRCSCCQKELISNLTLRELFFSPSLRCYHCEKLFTRIEQRTTCPGCGRADTAELCQDCRAWQGKLGFVMGNKSLFRSQAIIVYAALLRQNLLSIYESIENM